jgi:muconate cycloisomerase
MRILECEVFPVQIPLRTPFPHNLSLRKSAESVVIRLRDELGNVGYGEGSPREYVTGESLPSVTQMGIQYCQPWILGSSWKINIRSQPDILDLLRVFHENFPSIPKSNGIVHWNALRTAMEIAFLDLILHRLQKPFFAFFPPVRDFLHTALGIGSYSPKIASVIHILGRCAGFQNFKIKCNRKDDNLRLKWINYFRGKTSVYRLDANLAYSTREHSQILELKSLLDFGPDCIEEPFLNPNHSHLSDLQSEWKTCFMADENLVCESDALNILENQSYSAWSLRVSKLGGILPLLDMYRMAQKNHIKILLGCHVGELGILNRVGVLLGLTLPHLDYFEGGYGSWILTRDIVPSGPKFGYAGKIKIKDGSKIGFGYTVLPERLEELKQNYSNKGDSE